MTLRPARLERMILRRVPVLTPTRERNLDSDPLPTASRNSLWPFPELGKATCFVLDGRVREEVLAAKVIDSFESGVSVEGSRAGALGIGVAGIGGANELFAGRGCERVGGTLVNHGAAGFEGRFVFVAVVYRLGQEALTCCLCSKKVFGVSSLGLGR